MYTFVCKENAIDFPRIIRENPDAIITIAQWVNREGGEERTLLLSDATVQRLAAAGMESRLSVNSLAVNTPGQQWHLHPIDGGGYSIIDGRYRDAEGSARTIIAELLRRERYRATVTVRTFCGEQ